jgi:hypothetical protein
MRKKSAMLPLLFILTALLLGFCGFGFKPQALPKAVEAAATPKGFALRVSFALVKQLSGLQEGQPIPAWEGRNNLWPGQTEAFLRSEKGELALGRSLRANPKQRHLESALSPSMEAKQGFIHMKFGWRLHKQLPLFSDYADGTLDCNAYLNLLAGEPKITVKDTRLHYNASAFETLLGGPFIAVFEQLAAKVVEKELEKSISKTVKETTRFLPYKHLVSLVVEPETLVFYLGR